MAATDIALVLANDEPVRIRPIRPDDEAAMAAFHRGLSDLSVYQRYFHMMRLEHRITHERLARICHVDDAREAVLVMLRDGGARDGEVVGVARLTLEQDPRHAEFAVLVTDAFQRTGAGPALTRALTEIARGRGVIRLRADILRENVPMQKMCAHLGMTVRPSGEPGVVCAELAI